MLYSRLKICFLSFFAILLLCTSQVEACSLALHDWQLKLFFKIPINAPFVPLSEMGILQGHFKKSVTDNILWAIKPGILAPFLNSIVSSFDGWTSNAKWHVVADNKSVLKLAKEYSGSESNPIIVGSDKNYLKIALFFDANSKNNCWQLVIAQDSRIRCIHRDPKNPWAQEFNTQSWVSLISYQLPFPGNVISFSAYPINGNRLALYEDHPLVETLLSQKRLLRRPDLVIDPYSFDFPDLPE